MKEIQLPFHNIRVVLNENEGMSYIFSDLCNLLGKDSCSVRAVYALESVILAHAVAGLDIMNPMYLKGIETAIANILYLDKPDNEIDL